MERKHPKRKKDQQNNYKLEIIENNEYLLSFTDGEGIIHKVNISEELYELFNSFELEDISYMNEISRHYEHSELSEQSLNSRARVETVSVEDEVISNITKDELHHAINMLSDVQKRRVIMYYFYNMTYEQIARVEGCGKCAIKKSMEQSKKRLRAQLV